MNRKIDVEALIRPEQLTLRPDPEGTAMVVSREFRGHEVPEVLLNGNHEQIERWRAEQSYLTTRKRRADLLKQSESNSEE